MPIKYALYENTLTDNPDDHRAVVKHQTRRTMGDIIERMIRRGSTVTKAEALAVIEEYHAAIRDFIANGDRIATPMWQVSVGVKGVFRGDDDRYDPERHEIRIAASGGPELRALAEALTASKIEKDLPRPAVTHFHDFGSDTDNETLTPGGTAKIHGHRLKFDPDDLQQGAFFTDKGGTETRIQQYLYNKPSQLIVILPDGLSPGTYRLEVRHRPPDNNTDIRSGRLTEKLQVL